MPDMPPACVDMVLTDPPYNIVFRSNRRKERFDFIVNDDLPDADFEQLLNAYFAECRRILKPDRFLISFMSWETIPFFERAIRAAGFTIKSMPIWVKNNFGLGYYTRPQYEPMYLAMKGKPPPPETAISDILRFACVNSGDLEHSCQKPVALLQTLIRTFAPEGGLVFDGFMGSGSTAIAARKLNRKHIGFEIDPKTFEAAQNRIDTEFRQTSLLWE
jgi:site-specific DNA-methyltransferase (adenine-specific)